MKKPRYPTDKETGVRPITQIYRLPVSELSDEEVCKLFFARFEAQALVMIYQNKQGQYFSFGRLYTRSGMIEHYRRCVRYCQAIMEILTHNIRRFPEPSPFEKDDEM